MVFSDEVGLVFGEVAVVLPAGVDLEKVSHALVELVQINKIKYIISKNPLLSLLSHPKYEICNFEAYSLKKQGQTILEKLFPNIIRT